VYDCPDTTFGIVLEVLIDNETVQVPVCVFICENRTVGTFGNPDTNLCV
jgi:hypothetical protein